MSTGPDNSGDVREELHQLGKEIGDTLQSAPDGSRRTFLAGLASVIGIKAVSDIVSAQEGQPGAACQWLGDQDAAGYGLYRLGSLEFEDGTTLETAGEVTNTHINVENNGTQTLADVDAVNFATDLDVSDDGDGSVTVDSTLDTEEVQDTVNNLMAASSNLSWAYDDANDTLIISLSGPITGVQIGESATRNAGYFSTLDANTSITDAAGVSHSGELSDNPHDNADHSTDMVEDATTTGNAPYEVQKNGTDGTGVINFKT